MNPNTHETPEQTFPITTSLLNGILKYLGSRPYIEVRGLIDGIVAQTEASQKQETLKVVEASKE